MKILVTLAVLCALALTPDRSCGQNRELAIGSDPVFSPDGKKIMYIQYGAIMVMDIEGKNPTPITSRETGWSPSWSPDGKQIVFTRTDLKRSKKVPRSIWIINSDGTNLHQFIEPAIDDGSPPWFSKRNDSSPLWSPDGKRIVWTRGKRLWIAEVTGENAHALTNPPAKELEYAVDWSPDSKTIIYLKRDDYFLHGHNASFPLIWLIDSNGSNQRILNNGISACCARWSKQPGVLYYSTYDTLFSIKTDSLSKPESVLLFDVDDLVYDFNFSPDGRLVVFETRCADEDEKIFVRKFEK
jgi:Tol biopolymer transport system component